VVALGRVVREQRLICGPQKYLIVAESAVAALNAPPLAKSGALEDLVLDNEIVVERDDVNVVRFVRGRGD
jgi:hypothetical protein